MPNFEVRYAVSAPSAVMQVTADDRDQAVHMAVEQAPGPEGKIVEVMQVTELPGPEAAPQAAASSESTSHESTSHSSRSKSK